MIYNFVRLDYYMIPLICVIFFLNRWPSPLISFYYCDGLLALCKKLLFLNLRQIDNNLLESMNLFRALLIRLLSL